MSEPSREEVEALIAQAWAEEDGELATTLTALLALAYDKDTGEKYISEVEKALEHGLALKGGWREAIVELEDFCSEPVRLKNMVAAADQLDAWEEKARAALHPKGQ